MATTPLLGITQVSESQSQKEVTINDAIIALENATNGKLVVDFSAATSVTLTDSETTGAYIYEASAATADSTLNLPTTINSVAVSRIFAVQNNSGHGLTVQFSGAPGSTVSIPDGETRLLSASDGTDVIVAAEPQTTVTFVSLTDTPSSYTGSEGQFLAVKADGSGLEFVSAAVFPSYASNAGKSLVVNATEDGVEWADIDTSVSFLEVSDTPSSYSGQSGKLVAVNATEDGIEFIDVPEAEAVEYVAAERWRVFVVTPGVETEVGFGEIEFLDVNGFTLIGSGTASASSEGVGQEAELAFDSDTSDGTGWFSLAGATGDHWIEYDFGTPTTVRRVRLYAIGLFPDFTPIRFKFQYYSGVEWVDSGEYETTWVDGVPQTFSILGQPVQSVLEAPNDGQKYVRENEDWVALVIEDTVLAATIATVSDTASDLDPAQNTLFLRYTSGDAKTLTVQPEATTAQPDNGEWHIFNEGANNLTITAATGVTITAPVDGTLVVPTGGVVTLKRIAANTFKLIGVTISSVAAPVAEAPEDGKQYARIDGSWAEVASVLPTGGTTGQVLAKTSDNDGEADWTDPASGLPVGGTTGQVLAKASGTDGDVEWVDAASGGSGGGSSNDQYTLIEEFVSDGTTGEVTFASIPADYSGLRIELVARSEDASNQDSLEMTYNGDTGTNYTDIFSSTNQSGTIIDGGSGSATGITIVTLAAGSSPAGAAGGAEIVIPYYADANFFTYAMSQGYFDFDGTQFQLSHRGGSWKDTSAVNQIRLALNSGANFTSGSTIRLYGVKGDAASGSGGSSGSGATTIKQATPITGTDLRFESGALTEWGSPTGWTIAATYEGLAAPTGSGFAVHRTSGQGSGSFSRTLDLTGQFTDAELDNGDFFNISGYIGRWSNDSDTGALTYQFLDAADAAIGPVYELIYAGDTGDAWSVLNSRLPMPTGTRKISLTFTADLNSGATANTSFGGVEMSLEQDVEVAASGGASGTEGYLVEGIAVFEQAVATTTGGGQSVADAWSNRSGYAEKSNDIDGASITSDQITLPAGIYRTSGFQEFYRTNYTYIRLYDVGGNVTILEGSSGYFANTDIGGNCIIDGIFTLTEETTLEFQYYGSSTASGNTNTLGVGTSGDNASVFASITFEKLVLGTAASGSSGDSTTISGAVELIEEHNVVNASSLDLEAFAGSGYDKVEIHISANVDTDAAGLNALMKIAGAYVTTGYGHVQRMEPDINNASTRRNNSDTSLRLTGDGSSYGISNTGTGNGLRMKIEIINPDATDLANILRYNGMQVLASANEVTEFTGGGGLDTEAALEGLRIETDSGTFSGRVAVYGHNPSKSSALQGAEDALIEEIVVGSGGASSVVFSNIPKDAGDLELVYHGRTDESSNFSNLRVQFNGDTGATSYGFARVNRFGNTTDADQAYMELGNLCGANADANYASGGRIIFPGYADTTFYKTAAANDIASRASDQIAQYSGGSWASTAAINEITLTSGGNFVQGTVFRLYRKNAPVSSTTSSSTTLTVTDTARTLADGEADLHQRWTTDGAKTLTVDLDANVAITQDAEFPIANRSASGNLTISPAVGVTINAPAGGGLVLEPGMLATLKRVAADEFDLIGHAVSA